MPALQIVFGFFVALIMSMITVPLVMKLAISYGLYDQPDKANSAFKPKMPAPRRRVHINPTPRLGGVAIFLSYIITNFLIPFDPRLHGIILCSLVVFVVGFIDDIIALPALFRLASQVICASLAVWSAGLSVGVIAITSDLVINVPTWLAAPLAVFIIVGAINAINMIDGLDGLAGGLVLIGLSLLSFMYFLRTHELDLLLYLTFPIVGAIIGFLKYNTHPATIFMGDCGSNWLGFMLGVFFVVVLGDFVLAGEGVNTLVPAAKVFGAPHVPLVSLILCMPLPIIDSACVIISRIRNHQSPMAADNRHFHHTLLKLGFSHSQSVTALYFLSLVAGISGVLPVQFPQYQLFWIPYASVAALLILIPTSTRASGSLINKIINIRMELLAKRQWSGRLTKLVRYWESFNRYTIYAILIISPALAGIVKSEIGYAAAIASCFLFMSFFFKNRVGDFIDSLILSLATVVLLVANNQNNMRIVVSQRIIDVQFAYNALFVVLFVSSALMILTTAKRRYLVFTPSDFLLVTLPLILMLIPEPFQSEYRFNIICLRSMIIFVALRNMSRRKIFVVNKVRAVCLLALIYVSATSLLGVRIIYD